MTEICQGTYTLEHRRDIIAKREPKELLTLQIDLAIEQNIPFLFGMDAEEFRKSLEPLYEKTKGISKSNPGNISCLLVFPFASIPRDKDITSRIDLIQCLRFNQNKIKLDSSYTLRSYLKDCKYVETVPDTAYLAIDVSLGGDMIGSIDEKEDEENWEDGDMTYKQLKNEDRNPLTFEEGLALHILFGPLARWDGFRLIGTSHVAEGWPDLSMKDEILYASDHNIELTDFVKHMHVPHCKDRIGY